MAHWAPRALSAANRALEIRCHDLSRSVSGVQDCGSTYKAANLQAALANGFMNVTDLDRALGRVMCGSVDISLDEALILTIFSCLSQRNGMPARAPCIARCSVPMLSGVLHRA